MFSSVYNWAVSKVVYPPSVDSSLSSSAISASSSRPSPLCIDEKYVSDDEFIVVHTPDIKQTPPPTPKLLTDFNECIINNYQENHEQYNVPSGPTLIDSLSDSPRPDALPYPHPHPSLSPIKTNFEESKENPNDTGMNEKIGFRVLRFTRDGLIKNETNLSPSPSDTLADQPSAGHVRSLYQLAVSGDGGAITQLNYLSEKQKNNKRMQEIGVSNKSLIAKREKKTIKLSDDHTVYEGSSKGGKSEPDWNKINERQAAKRALQQQRRLNDKLITKDRRAAAHYKSGGSVRKGKNKIRLDDE